MRRATEAGTFLQADHATLGGNQQLADRIRRECSAVDVLVNNVGGLYQTRRETTDGYEATLAMDFIGPFTLTDELLPRLRASTPARCLDVVSAAFKMWKADPFEDIQSVRRYVSGDVYARAKLLNVLLTLAFARRLPTQQLTINLVHPGLSWTHMTQSMTSQTIPSMQWAWPLIRLVQRHRSPEKAGRRVASLVVSPGLATTDQYFEAGTTPRRLSNRERNQDLQERAWRLAADLVASAPANTRRAA